MNIQLGSNDEMLKVPASSKTDSSQYHIDNGHLAVLSENKCHATIEEENCFKKSGFHELSGQNFQSLLTQPVWEQSHSCTGLFIHT